MSILKLFNFLTGKRKDDENFYEYGMTHKEAILLLLKNSGEPLSTEQIMADIHKFKLRRSVKNISSLKGALYKLYHENKLKYQSIEGKWSI
jgi:hypothetical protein